MKKIIKILNLAAILLLMAGAVSSCGKEREETVNEIEFTKYAINEFGCRWENLNYDDKIIIINSMQDFGNYANCTESDLSEIDFSKNTLLLASGVNTGGIDDVDATLLTKIAYKKDEYVLDVIIYKNDVAVASENWQIAVLTPKISSAATVSVNKNETDNGNVAYAPCACDDKPLAALPISSGEAYVFKDSIPSEMAFQIVNWIVFYSKTDTAVLTIKGGGAIEHICEICNYPDFAKDWNIPINGCKVYFEGIAYESCTPKGGIATVSHYDYILTVLKRK
jgi:hypothetical protein